MKLQFLTHLHFCGNDMHYSDGTVSQDDIGMEKSSLPPSFQSDGLNCTVAFGSIHY